MVVSSLASLGITEHQPHPNNFGDSSDPERSFHVKNHFFVTAALAVVLSPLSAFCQAGNAGVKTANPAPAPRTPDGHPDLTAYWRSNRESKFFWHIGKDLPGRKLPFTSAGEAAAKHNQTATIDPISLCIIGGMPRRLGTGMAFEIMPTANRVAFHYGNG